MSHDQYLIESTVDSLWMCEEGGIKPFHGTFDEYKVRSEERFMPWPFHLWQLAAGSRQQLAAAGRWRRKHNTLRPRRFV